MFEFFYKILYLVLNLKFISEVRRLSLKFVFLLRQRDDWALIFFLISFILSLFIFWFLK